MQRISNRRQTEEVIHWQAFKNCGGIEPMQVHVNTNDLRQGSTCISAHSDLEVCKNAKFAHSERYCKLSVEGWTLHAHNQRRVGGNGAVFFVSAT